MKQLKNIVKDAESWGSHHSCWLPFSVRQKYDIKRRFNNTVEAFIKWNLSYIIQEFIKK